MDAEWVSFALIAPALILSSFASAETNRANQVRFRRVLIVLALAFQIGGAALLGGRRQAVVRCRLHPGSTVALDSALETAAIIVNGDTPVEPLVSVQTSPDVARAMEDLKRVDCSGQTSATFRFVTITKLSGKVLRDHTNTEGSGSQVSADR